MTECVCSAQGNLAFSRCRQSLKTLLCSQRQQHTLPILP